MAWQTAAGAKLLAAVAAPATHTEAGMTTLKATATVVGEVSNIGEFGKEFAAVLWQALANRGADKRKGSFNNGTINPTMALDKSDAGQVIMNTLLASDAPGTLFVELQDGSCFAFRGLVMSFKTSVGEADSVVTATSTIEITRDEIIEIPAP